MCTYRLDWAARRTSWEWWDEWDDTVLQTQDSKFEPRRSEADHATSRSRRLPTILNLYEWAGKTNLCFFENWMPERGTNPRSPTFQACSFNHCTKAPVYYMCKNPVRKHNIHAALQIQLIKIRSDLGSFFYYWHLDDTSWRHLSEFPVKYQHWTRIASVFCVYILTSDTTFYYTLENGNIRFCRLGLPYSVNYTVCCFILVNIFFINTVNNFFSALIFVATNCFFIFLLATPLPSDILWCVPINIVTSCQYIFRNRCFGYAATRTTIWWY